MGGTVARQLTAGLGCRDRARQGHSDHAGARARQSAVGPEGEGLLASERPVATVLAAKTVRPDYVSGDSFRYLVISDGKVTALAKTADEAARAAGPMRAGPTWVTCASGRGSSTPTFTRYRRPRTRAWSACEKRPPSDGLLSAVRQAGLRRTADAWTVTGRNWHESRLHEGRLPTRAELDALGLPGPVLVRRGSHLAVANSQGDRSCWGRRRCRAGAVARPGGFTPTR